MSAVRGTQAATDQARPGAGEAVYLSLGSNRGDRMGYLRAAVRRIAGLTRVSGVRLSSVYETEPVGYTEQDRFLNMVAALATTREPLDFLRACQAIENELGRTREVRWGPRTIDIDILLFGGRAIDTPELTVPHPRLLERAFALVPLAEVAPELEIGGRPVAEIAREVMALPGQGIARFASTDGWLDPAPK